MSDDNLESFGSKDDKIRRLDLFIKSYGLKDITTKVIKSWVIRRLKFLISFMENEAKKGNEVFKQHIKDGHLTVYYKDLDYINNFFD